MKHNKYIKKIKKALGTKSSLDFEHKMEKFIEYLKSITPLNEQQEADIKSELKRLHEQESLEEQSITTIIKYDSNYTMDEEDIFKAITEYARNRFFNTENSINIITVQEVSNEQQ